MNIGCAVGWMFGVCFGKIFDGFIGEKIIGYVLDKCFTVYGMNICGLLGQICCGYVQEI